MSISSQITTAQELAQQFGKQGIQCTDDESPQLWCSYCTSYLSDKVANSKHQAEKEVEGSRSAQNARQPSHVQSRASGVEGPPTSSHKVILTPTRGAVFEHCATRLHLHLYELRTQEGLRQWCPVELHGYRMLLDHHCIYPARMFGGGRMLMDFTIAGGMLLGEDVCGGVKLWPQHRYAAVELVLPSFRSGVREVNVPPSTPTEKEDRDARDSGPFLKRPKIEGQHHLQLLHEVSEISAEVAWSYNNEVSHDEEAPRCFRKDETNMMQCIPRYFDEDHGVHSRSVIQGPLVTVLNVTNASIMGEARRREKRRRYSVAHNLVQSAGKCDAATEQSSKDASMDTT